MKKVFHILIAILLLTAMLKISVAKHYCGGELAASKISITGGLATCGMDGSVESCPADSQGNHLKSPCCDDVVTYYSIDNNYTQSQTVTNKLYRFTTPVMKFSCPLSFQFYNSSSHIFTGISPPSLLALTAVDLTEICVFRI